MPILESPQKAFYDTRRQFQGNDDPTPVAAPSATGGTEGTPIGQVIAGVVFFLLIAVAFLAFALPEKPVGIGAAPSTPAAPAAPAKK